MINSRWPFTDAEKQAQSPGNQLTLVLINIRMNHVDKNNYSDVVERIGIRYLCGDSPLVLPNDDVSDLKPVYERLRKWTVLGWEMLTNLQEVSSEEFLNDVVAREAQATETNLRNAVTGIQTFLKGL